MSISYVLARAGEEGIAEAVVGAAMPFDPMLRGGIRKTALKRIEEAKALTRIPDEQHVIRVAFLQSIGRAGQVPLDDRAAVEQAFAATKVQFPKKKRAFWPMSFAIVIVFTLLAGVTAFVIWRPAKSDRFAGTAVGEAFGEGITDFTIGVDHRNGDKIDKGRKALTGRGVKSQASQQAVDQIGDALDHSIKLSEALGREEADRERDRVFGALRGLDATLAQKKVPAFLDEHDEEDMFSGTRHVWLFGYYAEQRVDATVGSEKLYVLWGRRLDTLNLDVGGTVYTSDALGASVVAIDEIEGFVSKRLLQGLAKDGALAFGSEPAQELTGFGKMEQKMGTALRAELIPSLISQDDATSLRDEMTARHNAFGRLHVIGDDFWEPRGVRMTEKMRRSLMKRDTEVDAKELLRIDEHLQRTALVQGYDAITLEQAKIAERRYLHDVSIQHRTGTIKTGTFETAMGKEKLSTRSSGSTGGWLGAVADSEKTTLALTDLARQQDTDGSVSLALFALESELGSSPTWLVNGRMKDEEDFVRALDDALKQPASNLKQAAARAYQKLLGEPVPTITRKPR